MLTLLVLTDLRPFDAIPMIGGLRALSSSGAPDSDVSYVRV
jgi:hypothetical protein